MPTGKIAGGDWLREVEELPEADRVVEVLACNWDALEVFQRCQLSIVGAGLGVVHVGISATECRSAIALLRLPRARWLDALDGAQHIGSLVAGHLNARR